MCPESEELYFQGKREENEESMSMRGAPWSNEEIAVAIDLYVEMLHLEEAGIPFVKVKYARAGAERTVRSAKSMEYKFQNISAVLDEVGIDFIDGFKPQKNYQLALKVEVLKRLRLC